jgi:uncharacterized protein (TIGR02391 family)
MKTFKEVFPPLETVLNMEPEELAVFLLNFLCECEEDRDQSGYLNRYNFTLGNAFKGYCDHQYNERLARALTEAWRWLEREGLIAPKPGEPSGGWIFITRRGKEFHKSGDIGKFKAAQMLPHKSIDPQLAAKVNSAFLRGEFDLAVFAAFREVEITVRELGGFNTEDIGVPLMRKAFKPSTGPLTDIQQNASEQEGVCNLYAGAIGIFKNPSSHRDVKFDDPVEAVELIMLADILMRMAKRRKSSN